MSKVLAFPEVRPDGRLGSFEGRLAPADRSPLSVVTVPLGSGEALPLLVGADSWLPRDLPLRWVVLSRRSEVAESTLRGNLQAVRLLYLWGDVRFTEGLDAVLKARTLTFSELTDLREQLRNPAALTAPEGRAVQGDSVTAATVGSRALAISQFLLWALSPANRNEPGADAPDLQVAERQIRSVLGTVARYAGKGAERDVPDDEALGRLETLIMPLLDDEGRFRRPLSWHAKNPFSDRTRLRFYLMWGLARDCGLRIGEILSLHIDDIVTQAGDRYVRVVRRPDDQADTRKVRPAVKTRGRALPMSPHVAFAAGAYLTSTGPGRRARGSDFLITTDKGDPLGVSTASEHFKRASGTAVVEASWHVLRHAWATDFARDRLATVRGVVSRKL